MTLTELRYVVSLAQEQHFGRAAERCCVSQPTLSLAVKKLEEDLGVAIFERVKQGIRITPLGEQLVSQAKIVLQQAQQLRELAQSSRDPLTGPLRIGAIYTVGPYLFPRMIPHVQALAPDMPLQIEESYTSVLRRQLVDGELDVILIALPFTEADVLTRPLYDEPFVVVLPANHALSKQTKIDGGNLDAENLLLLGEGHCFRDQVLDALPKIKSRYALSEQGGNQNGQQHRNIAEGGSLDTLRHMVASGMGITVLPQFAAIDTIYQPNVLVSKPFAAPAPSRTIALAWRASFTRPAVIDVLCRAISACKF